MFETELRSRGGGTATMIVRDDGGHMQSLQQSSQCVLRERRVCLE